MDFTAPTALKSEFDCNQLFFFERDFFKVETPLKTIGGKVRKLNFEYEDNLYKFKDMTILDPKMANAKRKIAVY
jgi:hypothetical protein